MRGLSHGNGRGPLWPTPFLNLKPIGVCSHPASQPVSQPASGVSARSIERQTGNVFRQLRRPPLTVWPTGEAHTCILRGAGLTSSRGILRWQLIVVNNGV